MVGWVSSLVALMPVSARIQRELFKHGLNRDGKTDTLGVLDDQGVDPVYLTVLVDQRAAAVAGIDGRVGWSITSPVSLCWRYPEKMPEVTVLRKPTGLPMVYTLSPCCRI